MVTFSLLPSARPYSSDSTRGVIYATLMPYLFPFGIDIYSVNSWSMGAPSCVPFVRLIEQDGAKAPMLRCFISFIPNVKVIICSWLISFLNIRERKWQTEFWQHRDRAAYRAGNALLYHHRSHGYKSGGALSVHAPQHLAHGFKRTRSTEVRSSYSMVGPDGYESLLIIAQVW